MEKFRPDISWSDIGSAFVRKGTSLVDRELQLVLDKAKAFAVVLIGVSIGFLIFYVGALLVFSDRTNLPLPGVMLGGGIFLMALTLGLAKLAAVRAEATRAQAAEQSDHEVVAALK